MGSCSERSRVIFCIQTAIHLFQRPLTEERRSTIATDSSAASVSSKGKKNNEPPQAAMRRFVEFGKMEDSLPIFAGFVPNNSACYSS